MDKRPERELTDCQQLLHAPILTLAEILAAEAGKQKELLLSCFYKNFREKFIILARARFSYLRETLDISFLATFAFDDAILVLIDHARSGKLYENGVPVEGVFYRYFWFSMLAIVKTETSKFRNHKEYEQYVTQLPGDELDNWQDREKQYLEVEQALEGLQPDCKRVITLWHKEMKSLDDIATILAIEKRSATNKIYRCMQTLRAILNPSKKQPSDDDRRKLQ